MAGEEAPAALSLGGDPDNGLRIAAHPSVVERPAHRTLRITFRRSGSLDTDRRRLAKLVETLGRYPGQDRFEIIVEAAGIARYQLDFPNNYTGVCARLEVELTECVGPGGWRAD